MASPVSELDTAAAVLDAGRATRSIADREGARILTLAVDWAAMHSVDSIDDAACDWFGDQPIPVAGPGAPLVAEFSIAEFATALGLSSEPARPTSAKPSSCATACSGPGRGWWPATSPPGAPDGSSARP